MTADVTVEQIRASIDHPVIDNDGHVIEYLPLVRDILVEVAGEGVAERFDRVVASGRTTQMLGAEGRREIGMPKSPWWGIPSGNTLDRATAMLPRLLHSRLDEMGIDVAFVYPTYGLTSIHIADEELRRATARAFNIYLAEVHAPYRDRLIPVACIPTFTPQEAVEELRYAVEVLGLRATMMGGVVPRAIGDTGRSFVDGLGHASPHDYAPLWDACVELGVSPTFHSSGTGWGSRTSPSNYVFNHIGNFAAAGELTARSLLFGGVPQRWPELRFAFQEGGTAWACNLYSDVLGHWEKRNPDAISLYDPAALDRELLAALMAEHAEPRVRERLDRLAEGLSMLSEPLVGDSGIDEFVESLIESPEDIRTIFTERYFFGCEADDPMAALAFDRRINPMEARLPALFASDIGHWDVPDVSEVLLEAWELVEHGLLDQDDFRDFTFANPVALWAGTNPHVFDGTVVEEAVNRALPAIR